MPSLLAPFSLLLAVAAAAPNYPSCPPNNQLETVTRTCTVRRTKTVTEVSTVEVPGPTVTVTEFPPALSPAPTTDTEFPPALSPVPTTDTESPPALSAASVTVTVTAASTTTAPSNTRPPLTSMWDTKTCDYATSAIIKDFEVPSEDQDTVVLACEMSCESEPTCQGFQAYAVPDKFASPFGRCKMFSGAYDVNNLNCKSSTNFVYSIGKFRIGTLPTTASSTAAPSTTAPSTTAPSTTAPSTPAPSTTAPSNTRAQLALKWDTKTCDYSTGIIKDIEVPSEDQDTVILACELSCDSEPTCQGFQAYAVPDKFASPFGRCKIFSGAYLVDNLNCQSSTNFVYSVGKFRTVSIN